MDGSSLVFITTLLLSINYGPSDGKSHNEHELGVVMNRLDQLIHDISGLKHSIDHIDTVIQTTLQTDDCVGNSHTCLGNRFLEKLWQMKGGKGLGKRAVRSNSKQQILENIRSKRAVDAAYRKQYVLRTLRTALANAERVIKEVRKRSCNVNLGFHCQTDEYSSIADLYDFLASDMSPGKRKRGAPHTDDRS